MKGKIFNVTLRRSSSIAFLGLDSKAVSYSPVLPILCARLLLIYSVLSVKLLDYCVCARCAVALLHDFFKLA